MDSTPMPIGQRIQALLSEMGQSASWLAENAGVDRSTVTRILNGQRNPTPETLANFAPVLGLSLEQLVVGTNAAERVEEAQNLVSRQHYETAIGKLLDLERKANDLADRLRTAEESAAREQDRRRAAEDSKEKTERELELAKRKLELGEREARKYREALERAVANAAKLEIELRRLREAVEKGQKHTQIAAQLTAVLAGVAAAASVANYWAADNAGEPGKKTKAKPEPTGSQTRTSKRAKVQ